MTFEETITDMSQLADIAYLPYGASINVGDVYYRNVTLSDTNGNLKSYYLTSKYTVIDYDNNSKGNGMEAVLLRNDTTGQFVISFRGTQEPIDGIYDITTGLLNYNPQIPDATAFVQKALDNPDYNISSSNLTLTGHSLGGILTQAVGADLKIQGYTFNAWSSSNLIDYSNYLLDPLGLIHRVASLLGWGAEATAFAERNILNLSYTDSGMFNGDPLSNMLSGILGLNEFLGTVLPIFGADLSLIDGHRMPKMITAINHYNILLNHFDNKDFLVLTMAYVLSDLTGRNQFYEKGESYFNAVGVYDTPANSLSFNFLDDLSASQIAQQAKDDRAVLFALIRLNGFAVEGTLSSYNNLNLADYSSMYIEDRSLMLFHMLDPVTRPVGDHYFEDRGYDVHLGSEGIFIKNPQILFGTDISETLAGKDKADHLYGGTGDDVLIGNDGNDYMEGGADFDTYITANGDIIKDDVDNKGRVIFDDIDLSGIKYQIKENYEDDDFVYEEQGDTLLVTIKQGGGSLTIENWNSTTKEALGIKLEKTGDIEISVTNDATELESTEMMRFNVKLQRELKSVELLVVELGYYTPTYRYEVTGNIITVPARPEYKAYNSYTKTWTVVPAQAAYSYPETRQILSGQQFMALGSVTFEGGESEKTFTYTWKDDNEKYPNRTFNVIPRTNETLSRYGDDIEVIAKQIGHGTIIDDDEAGRYDPLVLDTNKDGFISTTPLTGSTTYFDITGDGLRERIGWVSGEDALLALDKNDNGQIEGIDEIFGSLTESGFEELKRLVDSNHDNTIDRRDELFNQLQLWHDYNQDAMVQEGELKSLKDEGVNSIDLNYVSTRIEINGNLLTEASKYSTDGGTKELVADIQLATDVADTKVNPSDIPNFTVDESTRSLPQLKGSGLVYDAFITQLSNNNYLKQNTFTYTSKSDNINNSFYMFNKKAA